MATIGFIGGGNMAASLIGGLIKSGYTAADMIVIDPSATVRETLSKKFNIRVNTDINAVDNCEIIILAVKPQVLKTVCQQLASIQIRDSLIVSIAAGVRSTDINHWLIQGQATTEQAIVRCMPNTPALLQCGVSGLFANDSVSDNQKQQAENILQAVGLVVWVDKEEQIDAVTAVSGSGPAYFFLLMEAMNNAGEELGLPANVAQQLVLQTALGAAKMATESDLTPEELRKNVTSKGGTTEQAILSFQSANFSTIVLNALEAANNRSISLANELGSK